MGAVLLAMLTYQITRERRVALIAGALHAVSLSAMGQSVAFMAEALYLVIAVLGLLLFCRSIVADRVMLAATSGLLLGLASLTLTAGVVQVFALPLLCLANPSRPDEHWLATLKARSRLLAVATALMLLPPSLWILHNHDVYGVHYIGQIGPVNMIRSASAFRLYQDGTPFEMSMAEAGDSIAVRTKRLGSEHVAFESVATDVLSGAIARNAFISLAVYLGTIDDNVNTYYGVWLSQFPAWHEGFMTWKATSEKFLLRYRMLALCLLGLWFAYRRRQMRLCIVLSGLFIIFSLAAGVSPWQGNRLFYSGQIAVMPLMAMTLIEVFDRTLSRKV